MAKGHNIWKPQVYNKLVTLIDLEAAAAATADASAVAAVATAITAPVQVTIFILDKFFTIIQF